MEVLGATKHGGYKESLEFSSRLELPMISSEDDVLIEIEYTDANPVDLQKLRGNKGPGQPVADGILVPGFGGSGIVLETGTRAPSEWKGRRACFLADPTRRGSYATHILVDRRCVALLPSGVTPRDAASVPVAGLTALESLRKVGLAPDGVGGDASGKKSLLIVGGAGGVGKLGDCPREGVASLLEDHGHGVHEGAARMVSKPGRRRCDTTRGNNPEAARRGRWIRGRHRLPGGARSRPFRRLRRRYSTVRFPVFGRRREEHPLVGLELLLFQMCRGHHPNRIFVDANQVPTHNPLRGTTGHFGIAT
jgi:hypothetical protein